MTNSGMREQLVTNWAKCGAIYHAYSEFAHKGKYALMLNHEWPPKDGYVICAYATSKVDRFVKAGIPSSSYLLIEPCAEYEFWNVPTIIDLTDLKRMLLAQITRAPQFRYVGQISASHLKEIRAIVAKSTYVSQRDKRIIAGG